MGVLTALKGMSTPSPASQVKSLNINGPMANGGDLINSAILETEELTAKLKLLASVTDAGDANLAVINAQITALD
jgi:hypothetical protein